MLNKSERERERVHREKRDGGGGKGGWDLVALDGL